jgi:endonuclease/exonuclease/phosphatase (EEP) superfamily protein YafD
MKKRPIHRTWIASVISIVMMTGCIRIPDENLTVSYPKPLESREQTAVCGADSLGQPIPDHPIASNFINRTLELDAGGFTLVNWNIFKGRMDGWETDFRQIIRDTDILILQEAYLTENLKGMLNRERYHWDMTVAFEYSRIEAGVLTAARTAPNFTCAFRETEPVTRIPKSVLITRYPVSGTDHDLLVANIHAVNFTMGTSAFQEQIERLENVLSGHRGPVIVSGDFNTWNADRMALVNEMAKRLGLAAVEFEPNSRSLFLGQPVDHIFFRGLETKHASTSDVSTSDHNPLSVVFKLAATTTAAP